MFKPQATTRGNDEEVRREMIKKEEETEIVAKNGNNLWGWFLKLLTQLFKKLTMHVVDQPYLKYANGIEGRKTDSEGKTKAKDKAKAREKLEAEEENAQVEGSDKTTVEGSVYVFVFVFGGADFVMVNDFKE
ncbi:hypothetical protein Q3G72_034483 [Acer saccharum]|nr:hypothetical protein Q3G72_034483 [Acer saccharum]